MGENPRVERMEEGVERILSLQGNLRSYLGEHVLQREPDHGFDIADVIEKDPQRAAKTLAKPTVVTVVSKDGLTYTLDIGAAEDRKHYAVGTIKGDLPEARKPVKGEKPEDAAARDKAFAARIARVRARLPDAQTLAKYALLIPDTTLVDLTKKRAELLEKPPAKKH